MPIEGINLRPALRKQRWFHTRDGWEMYKRYDEVFTFVINLRDVIPSGTTISSNSVDTSGVTFSGVTVVDGSSADPSYTATVTGTGHAVVKLTLSDSDVVELPLRFRALGTGTSDYQWPHG